MSITEKQKTELSKSLKLYRSAIKQAAQAMGAKHKGIAEKVVEKLADVRGPIDQLVSAGKYAPSVTFKIKELQQQQRVHAKGFVAAIKTGDLKASRQVLRFLIEDDAELSGLCGIDVE